jgi:alginate O-acetyltransferase complex protein AlgI
MSFQSVPFLVFLPAFLLCYFLTKGRVRLAVCLVGTYIFCGWADWRFAGLLFASTLADYLLARYMLVMARSTGRRTILVASIVINLGSLMLFKYSNFFIQNFATVVTGTSHIDPALRLILPVGISFYTFQKIGYMVDLFRGTIQGERSFLRFALFVSFFPKLVAGPIVGSQLLLPQLQADQRPEWNNVVNGLELMLQGFFKKAVIANSLAVIVDHCFATPEFQTSLTLIIGAVFYAFQIYCDFSGYSDIAIGLGRVLGFDLGINFNHPYFAASFSEFWKRWHISLSQWLKDYLYIPLGGNRCGTAKTIRNLFITMLACGLWHGANWTFLIWGGLHAIYLAMERGVSLLVGRMSDGQGHALSLFYRGVQMVLVFTFVTFAWIFFRAASVASAFTFIQGIVSLDNLAFSDVPLQFWVVKGLILIGLLVCAEGLKASLPEVCSIYRRSGLRLATNAVLLWCIALLGVFSNGIFIYSRF